MLFQRMVETLVHELEESPSEERNDILTRYFNSAVSLEVETEAVGAHGFLWDCIDGLYEKSEENIKRADRARLALGGIITHTRLTGEERLFFASILFETFKKVFGTDPFSFSQR